MKAWARRALGAAGLVVGAAVLGVGGYVAWQVHAFEESVRRVYDVPPLPVERVETPEGIARGKHLSESVAPCAASSCHGADLGGGEVIEMGPVATITGSNVTRAIATYSDGELARLLRHGIRRDGRTVVFMPVQDFAWLPDPDLAALVSYLRTLPVVDRAPAPSVVKVLGKVLDRRGQMVFDVARRIEHEPGARPKGASPTIEYGRYLARSCQGCHGETFSGGRLPGAPSTFAIPLNLTPDASGLADWTLDDFNRLLDTGTRRNGKRLDALMPYESFKKLDDVERRALWGYLRSLAPLPFGGR